MKLTNEEHMDLIAERCRELLAIAGKRTPGEWYAEDPHDSFCGNPYCTPDGCHENHASGE